MRRLLDTLFRTILFRRQGFAASKVQGRSGLPRRRGLAFEPLEPRLVLTSYFVSTSGDDSNDGMSLGESFRTIQKALDEATSPGDAVYVRGGVYQERIEFRASGNGLDGPISLQPYAAEQPILDGGGGGAGDMIMIRNRGYIRVTGLEIRNNLDADDASGIRIVGAGSHIELRDNVIHDMRGESAMGITVYGTSTSSPISNLVIEGNHIYDCEPSPSEALTLNGNVKGFQVVDNLVHDVNNIGIDLIGGEKDINPNQKLVARQGVVRGNTVHHARSNYGGGFAGGIYVDGGRNIVIEGNTSYENDLGIEIGAENKGIVTRKITVRNNLVYDNDKAGIVFGGYAAKRGRVRDSLFIHNTVVNNDTLNEGLGQLWIQYASNNVVANNIFVASGNNVLLYSEKGNVDNVLDYNLWHGADGPNDAEFTWNGDSYSSFSQYRNQTGQDAHSLFGDPVFVDSLAGDFHLQSGSPAIDAAGGAASWLSSTDFDGTPRPQGGGHDIGAFEF